MQQSQKIALDKSPIVVSSKGPGDRPAGILPKFSFTYVCKYAPVNITLIAAVDLRHEDIVFL